MRLLTTKGVEDEDEDEEDWGRNQALRMRGTFRTEALELGRTAAFDLSAIVLVIVLVLGL